MIKRHRRFNTLSTLPAVLLLPFLGVQEVSAHGYTTYPKARQVICAEEGNVWSGTPPMQGCAVAKETSGTYPFVQINEFSINIADYYNQATVEAMVPDGTLCHANDPRKQGMSEVNNPAAWTRTTLNAGTFTYTFNATAPHNPSFWKFYITKQGTDLTQPLKWSDLELIKEDSGTTVTSTYSTDITIPSDRSGDHILFVRWQRIDPVGEGFYNCSDITVNNDDVTDPEPAEPYLVQGEEYTLPQYQVGERVIFDVINKNGDVHNSFSIDVTEANYAYIPELLAADVSGYYQTYHDGNVFIGAWHEDMGHYMYFDNGTNYFNSKSADASFAIRVEQAQTNPIALGLEEFLESDHVIEHGEYANLVIEGDFNSLSVEEVSGLGVDITQASSFVFIGTENIPVAALPAEVTLKVTSDPNESSQQQDTISFTVVATETPPTEVASWDVTATYVADDVVLYDGTLWKAHWWVQGGENPEATYAADIWGVWRPYSE